MIALSRAVALRRHPRARWGHLSCRLFFSQLAAGSQKFGPISARHTFAIFLHMAKPILLRAYSVP